MAFDQGFLSDTAEVEKRLLVEKVRRASFRRITRHRTLHRGIVWVKRVERFSPFLWLVKGSPKKAFARDRRAREFLWRRGVPVPAVVVEGNDFIALEDAGPSLTKVHKDPRLKASDKAVAYRAAGRALARLHGKDLAHGRPAFRDMCWDGRQIRFIDFEYFSPTRAGLFRKTRDLAVTVTSALAQGASGPWYAYLVLRGYLAAPRGRAKGQDKEGLVRDTELP